MSTSKEEVHDITQNHREVCSCFIPRSDRRRRVQTGHTWAERVYRRGRSRILVSVFFNLRRGRRPFSGLWFILEHRRRCTTPGCYLDTQHFIFTQLTDTGVNILTVIPDVPPTIPEWTFVFLSTYNYLRPHFVSKSCWNLDCRHKTKDHQWTGWFPFRIQ